MHVHKCYLFKLVSQIFAVDRSRTGLITRTLGPCSTAVRVSVLD